MADPKAAGKGGRPKRLAATLIPLVILLVALGLTAAAAATRVAHGASAIDGNVKHAQNQSLDTATAPNGQDRTKRRTSVNSKLASTGKGPSFVGSIGNVTAVVGRDVRLVCTVENLGQHQVAWLKEETKTILSIDTNIIITNYRIFLIPDDEGRKWVLHIKDVQESDRGSYQCQINTNPKRSISGFLDVVVPPSLVETESTQVAEVIEHSNVSLQCKATGHPRPTIGWHREDGEPIKLTGGRVDPASEQRGLDERRQGDKTSLAPYKQRESASSSQKPAPINQQMITHLNDVRSDRLSLTNVDRSMAGLYICTASNGIPNAASRQIPLYVKFVPKVSIPVKAISVNLGDQLDIDCLIEAFPKPNSFWSERQFIEPQPLPAVSETMPSNRLGSRANGLRFRRLDQLPSRWQQGHKFLMARALVASPPRAPLTDKLEEDSKLEHNSPTQDRIQRQIDENPDELEDWDDGNAVIDGQPKQRLATTETGQQEVSSTHGPLFSNSSLRGFRGTTRPTQKLESLDGGYVTVKQTALNAYTYKLRISIAKMRLNDFGEYVCTASNSMGTSSARVLVKKRSNHTPAAAAVESTLVRPANVNELPVENQDYQRDGMSQTGVLPQSTWNSGQFIQVHRTQQVEGRISGSPSSTARQSNRVYDENYLQSIRNRLSPSNYVISSSGAAERNSAVPDFVLRQATIIWLFVLWSIFLSNYEIIQRTLV